MLYVNDIDDDLKTAKLFGKRVNEIAARLK